MAISCKKGVKWDKRALLHTRLDYGQLAPSPMWMCLVSEEQRSLQSDVIRSSLSPVWSYRHGCLTRRLQHGTQQTARKKGPFLAIVPLTRTLPTCIRSGLVARVILSKLLTDASLKQQVILSVKISVNVGLWVWPDVSPSNVSPSRFALINESQRAWCSVSY